MRKKHTAQPWADSARQTAQEPCWLDARRWYLGEELFVQPSLSLIRSNSEPFADIAGSVHTIIATRLNFDRGIFCHRVSQIQAEERREEIRTCVDSSSRLGLLSSASSSSRLTGLLDPPSRRSGCLARSFGFRGSVGFRRLGRSCRTRFGLGDLAQLLELLLDGAGSANDGVGGQLERSQLCDSGG